MFWLSMRPLKTPLNLRSQELSSNIVCRDRTRIFAKWHPNPSNDLSKGSRSDRSLAKHSHTLYADLDPNEKKPGVWMDCDSDYESIAHWPTPHIFLWKKIKEKPLITVMSVNLRTNRQTH